jgi:hypothetical protein
MDMSAKLHLTRKDFVKLLLLLNAKTFDEEGNRFFEYMLF